MKKIIIAAGTGFLGKTLSNFYDSSNYQVVILSRSNKVDHENVRYRKWDGKTLGSWAGELENADTLINLTGKSVDCRYNEQNMQEIYSSRLDATHVLGKAIASCKNPPKVWINAASATIYRHAEDREMDELTGEIGTGFSVDVCQKWEKAFNDIALNKTRKVLLRIAIVLGKNGGALQPMFNLTKFGLGGRQGSGKQYFSWIHEKDFSRIIDFAINNDAIQGVYNAVAPTPTTNEAIMSILRAIAGMPFGLPMPKWLLEIGAYLIGTETELILKSRRVVPYKLQQAGFEFEFSNIQLACKDLID